MFDDWFIQGPEIANAFIKDKDAFFAKFEASPMEELSSLRLAKKWVNLATNPSVEKCAEEVFKIFLKCFRDGIMDLTHHFPKDARNTHKETGADLGPFWHGHKRFPQIPEWDPANPAYINFIYHATNILVNQVFDLQTPVDRSDIKKICQGFDAPEWKFSGDKIELEEDENKDDDQEEKAGSYGDEEQKELAELKEELKKLDVQGVSKLKGADFEKDDEKNHHIDIITSATNMRAWNYRIKTTTAAHCRMIAGKIIPAIATTTACITGFIGLEILKQCKVKDNYNEKELARFRMASINLAVNNISMELLPDPKLTKSGMDPKTYMELKAIPEGYTTWDSIEIREADLTLQQFLDHFKKIHHDCTITLLGNDTTTYYSDTDTDNSNKLGEKLIKIV